MMAAGGLSLPACGGLTIATFDDGTYIRRGTAYRYYYYPRNQVYYSSSRRLYYWNDSRGWRASRSLPNRYRLYPNRVFLQMDTPRPYTRHNQIIIRFP